MEVDIIVFSDKCGFYHRAQNEGLPSTYILTLPVLRYKSELLKYQ